MGKPHSTDTFDAATVGQIKSRERVSAHGEVYTADREVNAMLDLVKQETERIDSRFLEPACGNGNFLVKILERKLNVADRMYKHNRKAWECHALMAVGSIYGVDILQDNVDECCTRLFSIFSSRYAQHFCLDDSADYLRSIAYVLSRNILWGDALTLMRPDGSVPIVFAEWEMVGNKVKRRDYTLDNLLRNQPMQEPNLFSDLGDEAFIPTPIKEYPPTLYNQLYTHDHDKL